MDSSIPARQYHAVDIAEAVANNDLTALLVEADVCVDRLRRGDPVNGRRTEDQLTTAKRLVTVLEAMHELGRRAYPVDQAD
jgi:hypothetical protein